MFGVFLEHAPIILRFRRFEEGSRYPFCSGLYNTFVKTHPGISIDQYAQMIHEIQDPKDPTKARNPLDIAIPMWVNDLHDGIPYKNLDGTVNVAAQKKIFVVPWFTGSLPTEADGVEVWSAAEISFELVGSNNENITLLSQGGNSFGYGTNKDGNILRVYVYPGAFKTASSVATAMSVWDWLIQNKGTASPGNLPYRASFTNFILNGGLKIQ